MADSVDFEKIGKALQATSPFYANKDPNELGQLYMKKYKPAEYNSYIQQQNAAIDVGQAVTTEQAKRAVDYSPEAIQQEVAKKQALAEADAKIAAKTPSAAQLKDKASFNATMNFLQTLEKRYQAGGGATYGKGIEARLKGKQAEIAAQTGNNDELKTYLDDRAGFAATLKQVTGDTGVLTEQDYKRLAGLLPGAGATAGEATNKFNDLRQQIAAKYGQKTPKTSFQPQAMPTAQKPQSQQMPQISGGLGQILNAGKQMVGQVPLIPGSPVTLQGALSAIQSAPGRAINQRTNSVIDTVQAGQKPTTDQVVGMGGELGLGASTLVGGGIVPAMLASGVGGVGYGATTPGATAEQRVKNAGVEGILAASLVGAGKVAPKVLRPFKTLGENRATQIANAAGVEIDPQAMIKAAEAKVKTIPVTERTYFLKQIEQAKEVYKSGEKLTVADAVQLNKHLNDAYSASGQVGKSGKAAFEKITGDALKAEIKTNAPKVADANKLFSQLYGAQKKTKGAAKLGVGLAASAAIGAMMTKLLYGGGSR
jgi:hypothetical protein